MRITRLAELNAPPTGDGNNTGSFACRATRGATSYSQHAYGLAVDVEPVPEPLHQGRRGAARARVVVRRRAGGAPGMITARRARRRAFASVGWTWGGTWSSLKDLQHFSANGR